MLLIFTVVLDSFETLGLFSESLQFNRLI